MDTRTRICFVFLSECLLYTFFGTQNSCAKTIKTKFWMRQNSALLPQYAMRKFSLTSSMACLAECSEDDSCVSASWNRSCCLLSAEDQIDDGRTSVITPDASWTTASKIRFGIFHVIGENGRYSLTFAETKEACAARGGTIASQDELLFARSLGYELCACGWLSGGQIAFVIQEFEETCAGWFDDLMICNWLSTADVYCRFL